MAAVHPVAVRQDMEAVHPLVHRDMEVVRQPVHLGIAELRRQQQHLLPRPFSMRARSS